MKKLTILLFSILISFNSYGEWTKFDENVRGDTYYIDTDTIKDHKGSIYYWVLTDFLKPNEYGDMSYKMYKQGDCGINRYSVLSYIFYKQPMGGGSGETYKPSNSEWIYPLPDKIDGDLLKDLCHFYVESFEVEDSKAKEVLDKEPQENILNELKSNYINQIAARVRNNWRYQGAEDHWSCDVYILQDVNGIVQSVNLQSCDVDNSAKAKSFKNSIERAVYKSSPLPPAPDQSVFDREILFIFSVE